MINYSILCKSNHWPRRLKKIDKIIQKVLVYEKELKFTNTSNYFCNFVLANDKFIKKLNNKYKKNNKPTDVLTFVSNYNVKDVKKEKHCDIIFSIERITQDSKNNNIDFYNHITHLIIHSFLHINNFIHYKLKDFFIMKKIETKILKKLGIQDPY
ncbi:MAG: Endoribonuclease YbeY [Alphaproteobacteria bacterium MarineAlpha5_Bin8]|nr:MAG: Endoribonuclease YbeY [Alphaproteobacteria bacterium MarineAlpha5_Bin8]PPR46134.1 MAG: Endoribonuclease YbeY [Alphaproteobacteria bacterium MarineAlpha5_Bin7]|tara:strand:- start:3880 stop:4344 length:465 start_codon:yes stop_codon:yes gene_type:complete